MRTSSAAVVIALFAVFAGACESDIFDVDVDLAPRALSADFGASPGTVPTLTCDPAMPGACADGMTVGGAGTIGGAPAEVEVAAGCDEASQSCFAQAHARLSYEVNVLQEDDFVTKVERHAISAVRSIDIRYTVPVNTLTFDVPRIDVYVGPEGTTSETDPGVTMVDRVPSIPAGTTFTEARHLMLQDGSPARALLEDSIQNQRPFVFVLVTAPRMEAGAPMPGGSVSIELRPRISLGIRS